jgi:(p)ppGpp synthase/HD superfamily hydrolase
VSKTVKLPPNHHRSLSVTAQFVERTLDELELILRSRGIDKLTSKVATSYSEETREELLAAISKMRTANEEMVRTFELQKQVRDEAKILRASIAHLWVILSDSTSKGMRGFGALSPELASEMDEYVNRLLVLLRECQ